MTNLTPVAQAIENYAKEAGKLFALSEVESDKAIEYFAKGIGETPTFETYQTNRVDWVNAYVDIKPYSQGNSADQAFKRFKDHLLRKYPSIKIPSADNKGAKKKAEERAKKTEALLAKYEETSPEEIMTTIAETYAKIADSTKGNKPAKEVRDGKIIDLKKEAKELEAVHKAKTSEISKIRNDQIKALREEAKKAIGLCEDITKLEMAIEILDPNTNLSVTEE